MARPRKQIDKTEFEKLCGLLCTLEEIAGFFDCSADTIENWCKREYGHRFSDVYKKYSTYGRISLRRNQLKLSEKSPAMAIWLGKQWLGQVDEPDNSDPNDDPLIRLLGDLNDQSRADG